MIRDLDIAGSNTDARRLEVVAEGLSIFGGVATFKEAQGGQVPRVEQITRKAVWWSFLGKLVDDGLARLRLSCNLSLQSSGCTSHPSGERRGGVVQEVVQFVGVFGGQSGCSLAVGEAGQPWCGWPVAFCSGGVGRRAA